MSRVVQTPALVACGEDGEVVETCGRQEIEELADTYRTRWKAGSVVAIEAEPTLAACKKILALWAANRTFLPLHSRWDAYTRGQVLERFSIDEAHTQDASERLMILEGTESFDDIAVLMATSGTTASPKLARLPRTSLVAALRAHSSHLGWKEDDRWLLSLPTAHIGGLSILLRCFEAEATVVVPTARFASEPWLRGFHRQRVTLLSLVPTQLQAFVDLRLLPPSRLRAVLVGGASCSQPLYQRARSLGWPVLRTYGFTESCSQVATERVPGDGLMPLANVYFENISRGEIQVRTPQLFAGYLGEPTRPAGAPYATGDRGHLNEQGRLIVDGRVDDLIISGGENVSPRDVETRLVRDPYVVDACVFGIEDTQWGQAVCALLVADENFDAARFIRSQSTWPAHMRVRRFALVDALPRNANGKVDRQAAARRLDTNDYF